MNCLICGHNTRHRTACDTCIANLRRILRELEDYAAILAATLNPLASENQAATGNTPHSTPPLRVDAATMLDYRSNADSATWCLTSTAHTWRHRTPSDMDDHPYRSLPGSIHGISQWIREERGDSEPTHWTLISELRYLRTQISNAAHTTWIDELHNDLQELHHQAAQLAHDQPRPLGPCTHCTGTVYWETTGRGTDRATCTGPNHHTYAGLDLIQLGLTTEATA